jgi:hypothetical protein
VETGQVMKKGYKLEVGKSKKEKEMERTWKSEENKKGKGMYM